MKEASFRRRRVSISLLAALALHLLGMIAYQRWATERLGDEIPLPVRYEPMGIERRTSRVRF